MLSRILDAYSRTVLPPIRLLLEEVDRISSSLDVRRRWALRLASITLVLPFIAPEVLRARHEIEILGVLILVLELAVSWMLQPLLGIWSFSVAVLTIVALGGLLGFFGIRRVSNPKRLQA